MATDVNRLTERVNELLTMACASGQADFRLGVIDHRVEDGWTHLYVQPDRPRIEAEQYVRILADVESQAEDEFPAVNLLLVPVSREEKRSRPARGRGASPAGGTRTKGSAKRLPAKRKGP